MIDRMIVSQLKFLLNQRLTLKQARQTHAAVLVHKFHHLQPLLVHQLLVSSRGYSFDLLQYVKSILRHAGSPDSFSWGCLIRFLSQHGQFREACSAYCEMQALGLCPSTFAVSSALRACARTEDIVGGRLVHAQVNKYGFSGCVYVQTALVDLYSRLGEMQTAQKVFDEMPERNVVSWNSILFGYLKLGNLDMARNLFSEIPEKDVISWNSMISGYAKAGDMKHAGELFQQMPERNSASWNAMLSGYVDCGNIELARELFDAMPQTSEVSWIAMIGGYSKCGDVESACLLFDQLGKKNLLAYNAMIACYAQNGRPTEALQIFNGMIECGLEIVPDKITFSSIISACSQLGDLKLGSWIELQMEKLGIEKDDHLATALIDLHAKCGSIHKAYELFNSLKKKDVVAYSAMILGYAVNGKAVDAIQLFEEMVDAHICPNSVTFAGLLTAYSHTGLVEEGYRSFNSMKNYGLVPSADHYGMMVDLLGRAGHLEDAYNLIKTMPMQPHAGVWGALLLACRLHNNVEIGEIAARHCFKLDPDRAGYQSLLSNIYASVGRWTDVKQMREAVEEKASAKIPGYSWVEST
ncbi:hypothetical protein ACJRO7_018479 [Eucalyptus globulus]|uniref:Pentatricopeptide repeat-containing protein n=1 Tax=Eucalyptus globulus TaxID=34317 RepID=A0ABD3KVC4_EUCGL